MKHNSALAGKSLMAAGLSGAVLYLVGTAATVHGPPVWPYFVLGAMLVAGAVLYFIGQERSQPKPSRAPDTDHPETGGQPPGPAITDRWCHTTNGFDVPALMRIGDKVMSHSGYKRRLAGDRPPSMRIGMLVACGPLGPTPPTTELRSRFLSLISWQPIMDLLSGLTHVGSEDSWRSLAGNGRLMLEAALMAEDQQEAPVASAMLLLPEGGMSRYVTDPNCAELILHIELRTKGEKPALPLGLAEWQDRLTRALAIPGLLAKFVTHDLGLATSDHPQAKVAVILNTPGPMTELVDIGDLKSLPGSPVLNQFMGWAIADPAGKPAAGTARDFMTQLCEHVLRLNGYESVLAAIGTAGEAAAATDGQTGAFPEGAPLVVTIEECLWESWRHLALIVALRIKVTNTTGSVIRLGPTGLGFDWAGDFPGGLPEICAPEQAELDREVEAMQRLRYSPKLGSHAFVPARESISGWRVTYVPRRATGGTPRLTVRVRDAVGNEYLAVIEQKDPQVFRSS